MIAQMSDNNPFSDFEYRDITIDQSYEKIYTDGYKNFGWILVCVSNPNIGHNMITMKFKRDRKIINKAELTRLQRQFDACIKEITNMEKSKSDNASITAYIVGIIGTTFITLSTFAETHGNAILCIILAIPAFVGLILPYFLYKFIFSKNTVEIEPLIESKYNEIYQVSQRANSLLQH